MTGEWILQKTEILSLHETILEACLGDPDGDALVSSAEPERSYTRGEVADLAGKIAHGLVTSGFLRGGRIGLLAENCPEWGIIYLAILSAGGIVVPIDPALKKTEREKLLSISMIQYLFTADDSIESVAEIVAAKNLSISTIGIRDSIEGARAITGYENTYIERETDPYDTAAIIYTSGTTGTPKGVILTHRNLTANIESIKAALTVSPGSVFLSILPIHHTFEATTGFLYPMSIGVKVVYARALNSRDIIEDIRDFGVTCMVGVPLLFEKMYKTIVRKISEQPFHKRMMIRLMYGLSKLGWRLGCRWGKPLFRGLRQKAGLDTVTLFVSGGGPLLPEIPEWFNMLGFVFLEGYGLTECSPVVSVNLENNMKFGSVGQPLPGIEVKIDNPGGDGIGEIMVKGENNTPGYIDNPEATAELLDGEWLHTGDLGTIEDGHLFIKGRAKNLIITAAGKNVYPEEIEEIIHLSYYVEEVVVVGRKRENRMGEDICAIIYPNLEQMIKDNLVDPVSPELPKIREILAAEIKKANEHLASFKQISKFDIRLKEFEKTTTRKIKRVNIN